MYPFKICSGAMTQADVPTNAQNNTIIDPPSAGSSRLSKYATRTQCRLKSGMRSMNSTQSCGSSACHSHRVLLSPQIMLLRCDKSGFAMKCLPNAIASYTPDATACSAAAGVKPEEPMRKFQLGSVYLTETLHHVVHERYFAADGSTTTGVRLLYSSDNDLHR